jgi:RNA polymerase sigma factor (sigma-70 family)
MPALAGAERTVWATSLPRGQELSMRDTDAGALVVRATAGDQRAWNELVDRYGRLLWSVARAHQLSQADAADVVQTTWLRLAENLASLRDPSAVGAWLATTVRRESVRLAREAKRVRTVDDRTWCAIGADAIPGPEAAVLRSETDRLLWQAFELLPERSKRLLRVLVAQPSSYREVAAALGMPVGSLGPTRARSLAQLRRNLSALGERSAASRR